MIWQKILLRVLSAFEAAFDWLKRNILHRNGRNTAVHIFPYVGFGNHSKLHLRGRVVQNHRVREASADDSNWRNLKNIYYRFESDEIPYAQVTAHYNDQTVTLDADDEAYFEMQLALDAPADEQSIWQEVELTYANEGRQASATGLVLTPPKSAQFGVISDLDDTVIRTGVTNLLALMRNVFFNNSHTRLPFPGVAAFYNALQNGTDKKIFNPIFYVSNSPWNLYDLLYEFFELRGIPLGPIYLRDIGLTPNYLIASDKHKHQTIQRLLEFYPDLPFILIGDSGEHDADIYLDIVQSYPGRIPAVYIRDVEPQRPGTRRDRHVQEVAEQIRAAGSELLLIPDTLVAAKHSAEKGFIDPASLSNIATAVDEDRQTQGITALLTGDN